MNYSKSEKAELLDEVFEPNKKELERFRLIQSKLGQMIHNKPEVAEVKDNSDDFEDENYDSEAWLTKRTPQADKALLTAVQRGNSGAIKIFYQLLNRLVEKQEQKIQHEFSPEERIRIAREIAERFGDAGGSGALPGQHLLPQEIWENKG